MKVQTSFLPTPLELERDTHRWTRKSSPSCFASCSGIHHVSLYGPNHRRLCGGRIVFDPRAAIIDNVAPFLRGGGRPSGRVRMTG